MRAYVPNQVSSMASTSESDSVQDFVESESSNGNASYVDSDGDQGQDTPDAPGEPLPLL